MGALPIVERIFYQKGSINTKNESLPIMSDPSEFPTSRQEPRGVEDGGAEDLTDDKHLTLF